MRIGPDSDLDGFRAEVRTFLGDNLTGALVARRRRSTYNSFRPLDELMWWTGVLARRGWSVPHWPVEQGGTGWTPMQHFVFNEELARCDAPSQNVQGTHLVGPIVYMFGSADQKARVLPGIRNGTEYWAQGFSEPGSGSDLASLRTAARREGDRYVINGQKIWTSGAHHSKWGFFLVRTARGEKPQDGISFLLVPMDSKGITVRRIPQINGDAHLCEVFLADVEVPAENLVGEEGRGWSYAKSLLDLERTDSSFIYLTKREIGRLRRLAALEQPDGPRGADGHALLLRIARAQAQAHALEWSVLRVLADEERPYPFTAIASALKARGAELQQTITEIALDLIGTKALRFYDRHMLEHGELDLDAFWHDEIPGRSFGAIYNRAATIYGGTRQVQNNIIAKSAFGL